jgi:hypothetical protein
MVSLFTTEPSADDVAAGPAIHFEDAAPTEPVEFEIVLGRRQLASVLFVATVVIAVFSSISYLAGKSLAPAPQKIEVIRTVPVLQPAPAPAVKPEPPLFAEPRPGPLYLQMGAVEKGIAVIFAEGLRKHGFEAFVAPGPNERIFRVLIGPLGDEQAYAKARDATAALGLNTFARKVQQ